MSSISIDDYINDIKLQQNKTLTQSVSCIDWSTTMQDHFACTLWDGTLKIYQVARNQQNLSFRGGSNYMIKEKASINVTTPYPLTACTWSQDSGAIFLGTSRGEIKALDANSGQVIDIGQHQAAINYLKFMPQHGNTLLTSAYEPTVNFWSLNNPNPIQSITYSSKIFKSSLNGGVLSTAHAGQMIGLVSLKAIQKKTQNQSTQLGKNSPLQCIQMSKDGKVIGLGTVDGRVNVSYVEVNHMLEHRLKSHITFKAQKVQQRDQVVLYPVNSINFNNSNDEWFSTCGSDGTMSYWNHKTKSKIRQFNFNKNPVCLTKTSSNGTFMAYALGNDWHIGLEGEKWKPKIAVHEISQADIKVGGK